MFLLTILELCVTDELLKGISTAFSVLCQVTCNASENQPWIEGESGIEICEFEASDYVECLVKASNIAGESHEAFASQKTLCSEFFRDWCFI